MIVITISCDKCGREYRPDYKAKYILNLYRYPKIEDYEARDDGHFVPMVTIGGRPRVEVHLCDACLPGELCLQEKTTPEQKSS